MCMNVDAVDSRARAATREKIFVYLFFHGRF